MILYIQIENGVPINHPAYEENLLNAFGTIPVDWERFVRVKQPTPSVYKTFDDPDYVYEKIDGAWTDVWRLRDMTPEEKLIKQAEVKEWWASRRQLENFSAWVFDEATCDYVPPFPRPDDGKFYFWQGITSSWVEKPPYPDDGKTYRLNFTSAMWEEEAS
jgi:hypothetical protein